MKILVVCPSSKLYHLTQFGKSLSKYHIKLHYLVDTDFLSNFSKPIKQILRKKKFKKILHGFKPDIVLLDRQSKLGLYVIEEKIPLWVIVRGDIWKEEEIAIETSNSFLKHIAIKRKHSIVDKCLKNSNVILPISNYLTEIIKNKYPTKIVRTFHISARDPNFWSDVGKMNLQHPNIGLLQGANIWGKTEEMLILQFIIKKFPHVTFYWAGDGIYRENILPTLNKYKNFVWLGSLDYPNEVREYLASLDIYALVSGMDSFGQTILEASLMRKPTIATNVGGISEIIIDDETGFLVNQGDIEGWIEKISILLNDKKRGEMFGKNARKRVEENFSWEKISKDFVNMIKTNFDKCSDIN